MEADAAFDMDAPCCPSFSLTRDQMKKSTFVSFVEGVFRENPDIPMFKVVPPKDWSPTRRNIDLSELTIQTPIQQLVRLQCCSCHDAKPYAGAQS
jgi:hypothetical protein